MKVVTKENLQRVWAKVKAADDEIRKDVYDIHASAAISASPTVIERGTAATVNLAWNSRFKGANVTPVSTKVTDDAGTSLSTAANSTLKVDLTAAQNTGNKRFTVTTEIVKGVTKTAACTVTSVHAMYFGGNPVAQLTAVTLATLAKQPVKASPAGSYDIAVAQGQYMWLCVPEGMTINKVTSSGFAVPMEAAITVAAASGVSYKCYRSSSTYVAGTVSIVIS